MFGMVKVVFWHDYGVQRSFGTFSPVFFESTAVGGHQCLVAAKVLVKFGVEICNLWIFHHYCAMVTALVSLTWDIKGQPNCAQKQRGIQLFLQWAMMQGVAMLIQNRYQRQRLYTRIALGKAKRMDVVWGETAGGDGQLWLLYPLLFILQGFEAYVGLLLLMTALVGGFSEWQVFFSGVLLVLMAVGNFINTVQTLMAKSRFKAKMKRSTCNVQIESSRQSSELGGS
ncbi:hypothetical protein CJ030_MR4G001656 [Morella rubra]|uniref:Transmembrane protein 120 n=1 Tax=Morella rubra TaxID=262757 RepID=A0A6A1VU79_9ROSI|nr:hypothetical protein CJ030_MR4G001656 [Morella rubra]